MPINLFREVYMSFARLKERLTAFLKYRQLMASMNRFQSATDDELDEAGRTCIICRDDMTVHDCKRLPVCSHMFHKSCLREWLVQQQSCPTCRADIAAMEAQERARNAAAAAADQRGAGPLEPAADAPADTDAAAAAATDTAVVDGGNVVAPASGDQSSASLPQPPLPHETQPYETESARRQRFNNKYKTMRFVRKKMTPSLYRVVHTAGAPVYARSSHGWPAPHLGLVRTVENGKVVLCQDRQSYSFPGEKHTTELLQTPDGWIRSDLVEKLMELKQDRTSGQWIPQYDRSKFQ